MKIDYLETKKDLLKRIDIHNKFGSRDIDQWMLGLLPLRPGMKILDIGCGAGKQCFSYYRHLNGKAKILGGDVSRELLAQAISENKAIKADIEFFELDFNKPFSLPEDTFDLVSCCFAIYYAENIPFTIKQINRVLKDDGYLFTTGPMPENKKLFYEIISEATGRPIPPMPGSSRYDSIIYDTIDSQFSDTKLYLFENPLTFENVEPFMEYTRASLAEDRRLWKGFFNNTEEFEDIIEKIEKTATERLEKDGSLVMTKVVGGILAEK